MILKKCNKITKKQICFWKYNFINLDFLADSISFTFNNEKTKWPSM